MGVGGRAGGCGQEDGVEGMGRELKGLGDFGEGLTELLYEQNNKIRHSCLLNVL